MFSVKKLNASDFFATPQICGIYSLDGDIALARRDKY